MHSETILEISENFSIMFDEWWMLTMLMMGADDDADDRNN